MRISILYRVRLTADRGCEVALQHRDNVAKTLMTQTVAARLTHAATLLRPCHNFVKTARLRGVAAASNSDQSAVYERRQTNASLVRCYRRFVRARGRRSGPRQR